MTQIFDLSVKTGGFYDTNRRFERKNSLRIFMTQNTASREALTLLYEINERYDYDNVK